MWRRELKIEFHKGTRFMEALQRAYVPTDMINTALALWGDWSDREHAL